MMIGTDCTGICKSNYPMITTMTAPHIDNNKKVIISILITYCILYMVNISVITMHFYKLCHSYCNIFPVTLCIIVAIYYETGEYLSYLLDIKQAMAMLVARLFQRRRGGVINM